MINEDRISVVLAAGGNGTAIETLDNKPEAGWRSDRGKEIEEDQGMRDRGVEQVGFLVPSANYFTMAGGEFCGNAARSAAYLLARLKGQNDVKFSMASFNGEISAEVETPEAPVSQVTCSFPNLPLEEETKKISTGETVTIVDLKGIVHVLIEGKRPDEYQKRHVAITDELGLRGEPAVGVVWYRLEGGKATIDPVVWVKEVNSFYYESSCGSGSIAAGRALHVNEVVQPTGQSIFVDFETHGDSVTTVLSSLMEVK